MSFKQFLFSGAAILLIGSQLFAGERGGGCHAKKGEKPHRMWQELGLTEQQQTQIKELHDQMKQTRRQHWTDVKEVRKQIRDELKKENPDQAALDSYSEQVGQLAKQISQKRTNHLLEIKEVLTAKQFQQIVDQKASWKHGRKGKKHNSCNHKGSIR